MRKTNSTWTKRLAPIAAVLALLAFACQKKQEPVPEREEPAAERPAAGGAAAQGSPLLEETDFVPYTPPPDFGSPPPPAPPPAPAPAAAPSPPGGLYTPRAATSPEQSQTPPGFTRDRSGRLIPPIPEEPRGPGNP